MQENLENINSIVKKTLVNIGINVIDIGLSTTPTVAMMVISEKSRGGNCNNNHSHNLRSNALKFLNNEGECLNAFFYFGVIKRSKYKFQFFKH